MQDIRNLLQDWSEELEGCERIWIRASVSNRRTFFDYEGAVLTKGAPRLSDSGAISLIVFHV